ncbi:hypothetical protein KDL01_15470 [Actinospica durhamensis]|uniref:Uncharacterized protein n=1 Tax=Actinospica durhamensis TaxID=1508375 RepID=A0A941IS92_9ACTN|nr:hypothetical protein [Actinospica durhamensis]MBR7834673.1 hypothetical protein [Actinospica durhamensis]
MHFSRFDIIAAILVSLLVLTLGVVRYRKGERWLLALLPLIPVGMMLGIYASEHHQRILGIPAFALIISPVLAGIAARRRPAADQLAGTDC